MHRILSAPGAGNTRPLIEIKDGRPRRFKMSLLETHPWLIVGNSGGYCRYCKLFLTAKSGPRKPGKFIIKPYTTYNRPRDCEEHEGAQYHKAAAVAAHGFLGIASGKAQPINAQLNEQVRQDRQITRDRLCGIVKTLVFCARQSIALRAHRNESTPFPDINHDVVKGDINRGNFLELLQFRMEAGDNSISNYAGLKQLYTSHAIQNELLHDIAHLVLKSIISCLCAAKYFSVIADETTDSSNMEQLCVAVRYTTVQKCLIQSNTSKQSKLVTSSNPATPANILDEVQCISDGDYTYEACVTEKFLSFVQVPSIRGMVHP